MKKLIKSLVCIILCLTLMMSGLVVRDTQASTSNNIKKLVKQTFKYDYMILTKGPKGTKKIKLTNATKAKIGALSYSVDDLSYYEELYDGQATLYSITDSDIKAATKNYLV